MDDLIYRQTAINMLCSKCTVDKPETCSTIQKGDNWCEEVYTLQRVPSVTPERKKGRWIGQKGGGYCCSECDRYALDEVDGNFIHVAFKSNFCPYCGADMRG